MDAKAALEKRDVTPVLKWVRKQDEPEIRDAFARSLAVRTGGSAARELADQFFFETLVRIHRAGEGAPYTGLKSAGGEVPPGTRAADEALAKGDIGLLLKQLQTEVAEGVRKRFQAALELKRHAGHTVEAGREFVAAYVEYVHFIEGLHDQLAGAGHGQPRGGRAVSSEAEGQTIARPEHSH